MCVCVFFFFNRFDVRFFGFRKCVYSKLHYIDIEG